MLRKEYKLLSVIRIFFRIFAVIVLISGIVSFLAILIGGREKAQVPKIASVIWLAAGLFYSVILLLISEISLVLVRIEQNTRPKQEEEDILHPKVQESPAENQDTKIVSTEKPC